MTYAQHCQRCDQLAAAIAAHTDPAERAALAAQLAFAETDRHRLRAALAGHLAAELAELTQAA